MSKNNYHSPQKRMWTGIFIIGAGILWLVYKMGVPFPSWFFDWPMILIAVGLFSGLQSNFRNNAWIILLFLGTIFLIDDNMAGWNLHRFIWPVALILFGFFFLARRNKCSGRFRNRGFSDPSSNADEPVSNNMENDEFIDYNIFMGSIKKKVLSKNFRGGTISCVMGGAEIDLSQADMQKPAVIDISQLFGGTKIWVPSNWDIKSEVSAIFGGFEDKRNLSVHVLDSNKTLILKGSSLFGGIEISTL